MKRQRTQPTSTPPADVRSPSQPADEPRPPLTPPDDLPSDPQAFWGGADRSELERLADRPEAALPSALQRLGPLPLPRSGFPLIGFLATVYDHVANSMRQPKPPSR